VREVWEPVASASCLWLVVNRVRAVGERDILSMTISSDHSSSFSLVDRAVCQNIAHVNPSL